MNIPFLPGEILLPKADLSRWSVVACDQFTSDPDYWAAVRKQTGDSPTTLNLIFPEAYLGAPDFDDRIVSINETMDRYLSEGLFEAHTGMVYCRRTFASGAVRQGVVGLLDLECYDYAPDAGAPVRATEGTVLDRLPPRVKIRRNAALELPHVMALANDPGHTLIEPMAEETYRMQPLYDFPLMQGGGQIAGWLMTESQIERFTQAMAALPDTGDQHPMRLAIGDGNHSLATALECYRQNPTPLNRYAMAELCNLHDSSLVFEAVHRAVFEVDPRHLVQALEAYCQVQQGTEPSQSFTVVSVHGDHPMTVSAPVCKLGVGSVQCFLDDYIAANGGRIDYIHGEAEARALVSQNSVSILLSAMDKGDLFSTVQAEGVLPRKTFSMGEAREKRYYLECRRIQ